MRTPQPFQVGDEVVLVRCFPNWGGCWTGPMDRYFDRRDELKFKITQIRWEQSMNGSDGADGWVVHTSGWAWPAMAFEKVGAQLDLSRPLKCREAVLIDWKNTGAHDRPLLATVRVKDNELRLTYPLTGKFLEPYPNPVDLVNT